MIKKLMKKFLLPLIGKSFSFSPKKPFQILAERRHSRREVEPYRLQNSNWRCILEIARTEFCPRRAQRGSEWAGGQKKIPERRFQTAKEPENKSARTIFWKGKRNFFINFLTTKP